jgi:hypothetical protein
MSSDYLCPLMAPSGHGQRHLTRPLLDLKQTFIATVQLTDTDMFGAPSWLAMFPWGAGASGSVWGEPAMGREFPSLHGSIPAVTFSQRGDVCKRHKGLALHLARADWPHA